MSFVAAAACLFVAVVSRLSTAQLTTSSTGKNNHLTGQQDLYYYQTLHLNSITSWCYVYEIFFSESISRLYYEWSENVIIFNTFDLHRPWRYPLHRFCWYCKGMHLWYMYPHYLKIQNHKSTTLFWFLLAQYHILQLFLISWESRYLFNYRILRVIMYGVIVYRTYKTRIYQNISIFSVLPVITQYRFWTIQLNNFKWRLIG